MNNWKIVLLFCCFLTSWLSLKGQNPPENLSAGAYIINMGVVPQTIDNGLKPYGLLHELIVDNQIPVKWVINTDKVKDGMDFAYNGTNYAGGTFIVISEFIDANIKTIIANWEAKGVVGEYTTATISVPVYETLTVFPRVIIDDDQDGLVTPYYDNAGIPATAYTIGLPSDLGACQDVYLFPHAIPNWSSHSDIYDFVVNQGGYIWAQCHAVSILESVTNTLSPFEQMNFLSVSGLQCYKGGGCGSIADVHNKDAALPYFYDPQYVADPVMQIMGDMDGATLNGSEQWYIPASTGQWNAGARRLVASADGTAPGEGVLAVYGYAYDNPAFGKVMYVGGHNHDTGTGGDVATQRMMFNFILQAGIDKKFDILGDMSLTIASNADSVFSVNVSGGTGPYTYQWKSFCGGTFSAPTSASTEFKPDEVTSRTDCMINTIVTDACARSSVAMATLKVYPPNTLPVAINDNFTTDQYTTLLTGMLDNDADPQVEDSLSIDAIITLPTNGSSILNGDGSISYTPDVGFEGLDSLDYKVCDDGLPPLCMTARIYLSVVIDCSSDTTPPVISNYPADTVVALSAVECEKAVNWIPPVASENCTIDSFISSHSPGDLFPVGTTTVTYTATNQSEGSSTCTFNITIEDTVPPVFDTCPMDVINIIGPNEDMATISWVNPTVADNCGSASLTNTHNSGESFGIGITEVVYTVQDSSGNVANCSFMVEVIRNNAPITGNTVAIQTQENQPVQICLEAIDPDGDILILNQVNYTSSNGKIDQIDNEDLCFVYTPNENFFGEEVVIALICDDKDPAACTEVTVQIEVLEYVEIIIYKVITPNGDYMNDTWRIENIEKFPDNIVAIFDRWGSPVYSGKGYDNDNVFWDGSANEGLLAGKKNVPSGTYFYTIQLGGERPLEKGFIELLR